MVDSIVRGRRGQMELMGLVVIVMIVVVGLLFLIFFATQQQESSSRKSFDSQQLAYNTISTMLQTSTECRNLRIQELIQNCAWRNDIMCAGVDGCQYVRAQMNVVLSRTLQFVQQDYYFYVFTSRNPNENVIEERSGECVDDRVSAQYPLKYAGGELFVGLDICDRSRFD